MIRILSERGFRVAAIKHAAHGYEIDSPGKDSLHHYDAGAQMVIIAGDSSFTVHQRCPQPPTLEEMLDRIQNVDLIIVEGFKNEAQFKVEVYRQECQAERVPSGDRLLAVVSDVGMESGVPNYSFSELELLADYLLDFFQLDR
jgi:molybdopterin-guanine dinucleotide biosynthesis protein MobB